MAASRRHIVIYGIATAALLFLLKWLEIRLVVVDMQFQLYIGCIAVLFMGLGIWIAIKLWKPKVQMVVVEKLVYPTQQGDFAQNIAEIMRLGISKRELEVLGLMAKGMSNQEIADSLFVSLNTVKTHARNVFDKLAAQRRTQAVDKAKKLGIIP